MIISELGRDTGFFSAFFFTMNHYIYAVKNKQSFRLLTQNWLFRYKNGWTDYFEPCDINLEEIEQDNKYAKCGENLGSFRIREYQNIIKSIYRYNSNTVLDLISAFHTLNLNNREYGAIFVRRGDKLVSESCYIPGRKYVEKLLELYPEVTIIYVQTDDYNVVDEVKGYLEEKSLTGKISVKTNCPENHRGIIVFSPRKWDLLNGQVRDGNKEYVATCGFVSSKSVDCGSRRNL